MREQLNLQQFEKAMDIYQLKYDLLPTNLDDIVKIADENNIFIQQKDAYGSPYDYAALNSSSWYLRSPQIGVFLSSKKWGDGFSPVNPFIGGPLGPWPQGSLSSMVSQDKKYIARIVIAQSPPFRRLIVVKNDEVKTPVWSDKNHNVDEFVWLDRGLFYTSSNSQTENSSVHFYSLKTQVSEKVLLHLEKENFDQYLDSSNKPWANFNFAIIASEQNKVEMAITEDHQEAISPIEFFQMRKAFRIEEHEGEITIKDEALFSHESMVAYPKETASELTNSYHSLPVKGPIEEVIQTWQESAKLFENTPIFPNVLWGLSSLYRNASVTIMNQSNDKQAKKLDSLAAEYSLALSKRQDAPTWMKNCSRWYWQEHQRGQKPLYHNGIDLDFEH